MSRLVETLIMRIVDLQLVPGDPPGSGPPPLLGQGRCSWSSPLVAAQYAYLPALLMAATAERRKDYVEAALATPLGARRVIFRHLLPNCAPPLIVVATDADRQLDLA